MGKTAELEPPPETNVAETTQRACKTGTLEGRVCANDAPAVNSSAAADTQFWSSGPQTWCKHAGSVIDAIRINAISREVRDGRALLVKRRRLVSVPLAQTANLFFRAARHPVFVWADAAAWQRWEVTSFNLLHGEEFGAFPDGSRTVCADIMPGTSLAEHFVNGTFECGMLDAAGLELRRAHELHSGYFDGPWSHGDPNLANFLYSSHEQQARLIDFEVVHQPRLATETARWRMCFRFCRICWGARRGGPGWHRLRGFSMLMGVTGGCARG